MDETKEDSRRAAVLAEAFTAFVTYGYKRTTMDDIARAAGMSRPALYLLYRNKYEIFEALMLSMMTEMEAELAACFDADLPPVAKVKSAMRIGFLDGYHKIRNTPHGAELFDLKNAEAADLFRQWLAVVENGLSSGLKREAEAGRIDLTRTRVSPERLTTLVIDGFEGAKARMTTFEDLEAKVCDLVDVVLGPLTVR
ncbi:TetR/AcrR family transcriptional regulator [Rhizobium sp. RU36D]|uniref:TetR/AcrR family transcriptional regulator n=1 Tax=Rhizobium sp. RU36D TaxID=1907415 RepID=UPI0015C45368|nr:TetR/AcrR family transcriptional regulator [Rhizobium sp. RU36D]